MKGSHRSTSVALAAAKLGLAACAHLPSSPAPVVESVDRGDPAVAYANRRATSGPPYRESYVEIDGQRLHIVETGTGPLIILYHGFPSFWLSWRPQMDMLKRCFRVVALDAPGAGRSAKPADLESYRVDRLAMQLDRLAEHLAPGQPFRLIGHDWGGALAWSYAQGHADRLRQLVVLSAPAYNLFVRIVADNPEQQARSAYMQRFRAISRAQLADGTMAGAIFDSAYRDLAGSGALDAEELALFRASVADPDAMHAGMNWYRANIGDYAMMRTIDPWPGRTASTTVPTMLLWGSEDRTFVGETLTLAPAYADRLHIVQLPGVGHWASMDQPHLANAAIADFLMPGGRCPSD